MSTYLLDLFISKIKKSDVNTIVELGSRDLLDAVKLQNFYNCKVYAFECNPDCLIECYRTLSNIPTEVKENIFLVENAISKDDSECCFYPFDLELYNNMGSSSMLKIDFSKRNKNDPDYMRASPQKEIKVMGIRGDTFLTKNKINCVDLLCIDLQGFELQALKSFGETLKNCKYIITECSITSTYAEGSTFKEVEEYVGLHGFRYVCSDAFNESYPDTSLTGFSEFNSLFININL